MDADTLVALGNYCEGLIQDPSFQFVSAFFEQQLVAELLASKPHETKAREFIYSKISAHREFLSSLADFVKERDEAQQPQPDHLDDDPSVHNIHG